MIRLSVFSSIFLALLASPAAFGGILFEPYAGYAVGSLKMDGGPTHPIAAVQSIEDTGKVDGFAYGARAAWRFGRFFLGGEYQGVRAQAKLKASQTTTDWTSTTIFGVIGVQFFNGLRITGAMSVQPHESEESTMPESTKYTGSAHKIGLGYRYNAPIAINVEYTVYTLEDVEIGAYKGKVKDNYDTLDYSNVIVSLSFPFGM